MLSNTCRAILTRHVEMKGRNEVISELGISSATLSQVINDKYGASTDAIELKIMKFYGNDGKVTCPILGQIDPRQCANTYNRSQKITSAGNPATIRLYMACRKCSFR
jgi:hypothetical protein